MNMKRIVLVFLFLLMIFAACKDNTVETTQIPVVTGMSRPTALHDNNLESTQGALPTVDQEKFVAAYPGPTGTVDIMAKEAPLALVEPDISLDPYPGSADTRAALTDQLLLSAGTNLDSIGSNIETTTYGYQIVNKFPHDRGSHIQGLVVDDDPGILLEGSGLWGESALRRVVLESGEITQYMPLPEQYFGEGITIFDDQIIQLTWKSGVGFVYDRENFNLLELFTYAYEGWGITHDGQQLIVSDGTDMLHFWDPETLQETHQIHVYDEFGPVTQLNELEFMNGEILANVWQTDTIVRINPDSGKVSGWIDLTGLLAQEDRIGTEGVLNGIAYDALTDRLFVTGKRWPSLYEIKIVPLDSQD
jgi:glutamine cyclotransferase